MNYFVSSRIHKRYTGQDSGQRRGVMGQKTAMPCWTEQREFQLQNMIIKDSSTNFRNYTLANWWWTSLVSKEGSGGDVNERLLYDEEVNGTHRPITINN